MTNQVGFIGDVHGSNIFLKLAIDELKTRNVAMYCTGDVVGDLGDAHACISLLTANGIATVRGNHDEWLVRDKDPAGSLTRAEIEYLAALPSTIRIDTSLGPVLLCHGLGVNNMSKINPDDYGYAIEANDDLQKLITRREYKVVVNGHSHKKMVREFNGLVIVNAGSLVQEPCFTIIDFANRRVSFFAMGEGSSAKEEIIPF